MSESMMQNPYEFQETQQIGGLSSSVLTAGDGVNLLSSSAEPCSSKKIRSLRSTTLRRRRRRGFAKIPLPITSPFPSAAGLPRSDSHPINFPLVPTSHFLNSQSPDTLDNDNPPAFASPENLTTAIRRTAPDLTSSAYQFPVQPPAAITSPTSSTQAMDLTPAESPSCKRLKRMKDIIKEMSQWCEQLMDEDEDNNPKEGECKIEREESVRVERVGNGLVIHFRCPCGEGYQILLSGNNCYYKLI